MLRGPKEAGVTGVYPALLSKGGRSRFSILKKLLGKVSCDRSTKGGGRAGGCGGGWGGGGGGGWGGGGAVLLLLIPLLFNLHGQGQLEKGLLSERGALITSCRLPDSQKWFGNKNAIRPAQKKKHIWFTWKTAKNCKPGSALTKERSPPQTATCKSGVRTKLYQSTNKKKPLCRDQPSN